MFRRFQVMDLYHCEKDIHDIKEWVEVENLPNAAHGIFKVRLSNGDEVAAYYCNDSVMSLMKYFKGKSSKWWDKKEKLPLYNVTHWGKTESD